MKLPKVPFKRFLHALLALTPTLFVSFFSSWFDIFERVGLSHPDFSETVRRLALGISPFVVMVLYVLLHRVTDTVLRWLFIISAVLLLGSGTFCRWLNAHLAAQRTAESIANMIFQWELCYLAFLVLVAVTVILFMLYILKEE